eukprot:TRINITY_DN36236_c0_g1_i1.p1 TRINITY_DN36236_c0_g1~~TRINITY_DN36236_c0_g1_i1.p1  ORF type:complete len:335 (-),score=31.82 TRINITY_DN36236_c0_g1_i1:181-1185(-)
MKAGLILSAVVISAADPFAVYANNAPAHNPKLSRYINSLNVGWTASEEPHPLFSNRTFGDAKLLMGTRRGGPKLPPKSYPQTFSVPDSFDSRKQWPNCPTISEIRDQSSCGSCWAFGAAESMSDRFCTYFGDKSPHYRTIRLAAGDLMSCCDSCGNGCHGGFPEAAWNYWVHNGLVDNMCTPYPFPSCAHHTTSPKYEPCPSSIYPTPSCPTSCKDGTSVGAATHYYGQDAWSVSGERQFQQELLAHGPFEITLNVYQDFEQYKGGIYRHVSGALMGGHAVRLVGWGTANSTPYWIVANSWNDSWGEDGYFRILRGQNECGIESDGSAGAPKEA